MKKITSFIITISLTAFAFGQVKMRPLNELIITSDAAWPFIKQLIDSAKNKIEVLDRDTIKAKETLYNTQVTIRSPLGALIYNTGGILVDNGWVRILGSGNKKLDRNIADWNKGKSFTSFGEKPGYLLIADDAVGGFFALNEGALGKNNGMIYYLSPDRLKWEPLGLSYTDFLNFCFNDNLNNFYEKLRWFNRKNEVEKLDGSKVYNFKPYLWSKDGKDINKNKRTIIAVEKQFQFNMQSRTQLGLDKDVRE